jgi:MYXO-CTERM domain-containing protein
MIRRSLRSLAAVLVAGLAPLGASGEVSIDTFATPQIVEITFEGPDAAQGLVTAPEALGGERDVQLLRTAGGGTIQFQTGVPGDDLLDCSAGAETEGSCLVLWDGPDGALVLDPDGLGGIDLTEGGANDGVGLAVRADQPATVEIQVVRALDGSFVSAVLDLPGGDSDLVERFVPISAFGPGDPAAVFADAGAISMLVSGEPGFDVLLDDLRVTVPEPSGAAGAALAALGVLAARARRRPA